jgi:hypothetical protein
MAEFFDIVIVGGYCREVRLPSYQLDRAAFDEEVLRRACAAVAELVRPGTVTKWSFLPMERFAIMRPSKRFAHAGSSMPWGVAALLGRKEG